MAARPRGRAGDPVLSKFGIVRFLIVAIAVDREERLTVGGLLFLAAILLGLRLRLERLQRTCEDYNDWV